MASPQDIANAQATGWGSNVAGYDAAFASGGWGGAIANAPGTGQATAGWNAAQNSAPSGGGGPPANSVAWPTGPNAGVNNNNLFSSGYAYVDQYGIPHVVNDQATAQQYAKSGTQVTPYNGLNAGGYAVDEYGNRQWLNLPGANGQYQDNTWNLSGPQAQNPYLSQATPATDDTQATINAINNQLATINGTPTVSGVTPGGTATPATATSTPAPGAAGYTSTGTALTSLPSVDSLFNLYQQVTGGQGNTATKQYLGSPQFEGILQSGQVPIWMNADPEWRLYLSKLGVLKPGGGQ